MSNISTVPKLSVLMSIYNESERYIKESLQSLLSQTFSDFEVIVIIDNPDRTDIIDILSSYDDIRLSWYRNEVNIGLALSMNKAARYAKTEIFARMDADDVSYPNRFKEQYNLLMSSYYDFVFSGFDLIDIESTMIQPYKSTAYTSEQLNTLIHFKHLIHHPTVMFKKQIFDKVGGYRNFPCTQDLDLWFRMVEHDCKFFMINKPLLKYRINSNSVSVNKWFLQKLTGNYILKLSIERLEYGYDSYSWDNYQEYLYTKGINDDTKQLKHRKSQSLLHKAANTSNYFLSLFYRIYAFLSSSISREHYIMIFKKKILLNKLYQ